MSYEKHMVSNLWCVFHLHLLSQWRPLMDSRVNTNKLTTSCSVTDFPRRYINIPFFIWNKCLKKVPNVPFGFFTSCLMPLRLSSSQSYAVWTSSRFIGLGIYCWSDKILKVMLSNSRDSPTYKNTGVFMIDRKSWWIWKVKKERKGWKKKSW